MQITRNNPPSVPAPLRNAFSHSVVIEVGDARMMMVSGQMALDDDGKVVDPGDIEAQTERVFQLLGLILEAEGASFDDVVSIRTYLTDMSTLAGYGSVRARYLSGEPPASTTVEVSRLVQPEALVEADIVAVVGAGGG